MKLRATKGIGLLASVGIIAAVATIVAALVLSNILVYTNDVQGITLTSAWNNGPKALGSDTAFQVSWTSPMQVSGPATLMFKIARTSILPADVTLTYTLNSQLYVTNFVQSGADAVIGTTIQLPAGAMSGSYPFDLIFNAVGSYTMSMWIG